MTEQNTQTSTTTARRGRPPKNQTLTVSGETPRAAEVQERRRRRNSGAYAHGARLGVNEDLLDFNMYVYRWIKGTDARLHSMTKQDDWDIMVSDGGALKEDGTDLGSAVSAHAGTAENGSSERHYLCRKLKTFHDDDQRDKQNSLDELMNQLRRGKSAQGEDQSDYIRPEQIKV